MADSRIATSDPTKHGMIVLNPDGSNVGGSSDGLTDTQLRATPVPVSISGVATEAKQDTQITNQATLISLIDTLQELSSRLAAISGAVANTAQLRVVQTTVPSTAVTGPLTNAQYIATPGIGGIHYDQRIALHNLNAVNSNINNVVITI